MADQHLITSSIAGRLGAYPVNLYRREASADYGDPLPGSPTLPVTLDIADYGPPKIGELARGFGGGLLGALWEATFVDPQGYLSFLFGGGSFLEQDYYVHITGPSGIGSGVRHYRFQPMPTVTEDEQAPAVYPGGVTSVAFRCGIGALQDLPGVVSDFPLVSTIAARLIAAAPYPVRVKFPVWPLVGAAVWEAPDTSADHLAFGGPYYVYQEGPPVLLDHGPDPQFINFGGEDDLSAEDQLANVAGLGTLAAFLTTDQAAPYWMVVPRARLGTAITDATQINLDGSLTFPVTIPARTVTVDGTWGGEPGGEVPRGGRFRYPPSAVLLKASGPVDLLHDPDFTNAPGPGVSGDFDYWPTVSGTPAEPATDGGIELGTGDVVRASLGRFDDTPGLRFFVGFMLRARTQTLTDPALYEGEVRVVLVGDNGTTYYGPAWGTTPAVMPKESPGNPFYSNSNWLHRNFEAFTTADMPVSGEVWVHLVGENVAGDAVFRLVVAQPVGPDGQAVTTFTAAPVTNYVAPAGSLGKTIALPTAALVKRTFYKRAKVFTSDASGISGALRDAAAAERLAQTARAGGNPLRALVTTVSGLVGPEDLLTLQGAAPFDVDPLTAIVVGCAPDFFCGTTAVALCEKTTLGLT